MGFIAKLPTQTRSGAVLSQGPPVPGAPRRCRLFLQANKMTRSGPSGGREALMLKPARGWRLLLQCVLGSSLVFLPSLNTGPKVLFAFVAGFENMQGLNAGA